MKRTVLATVVAVLTATLTASAGSRPQVPFKGFIHANETSTGTPAIAFVHGIGSGAATGVGRYTVEYDVIVDLATGHGDAAAQFTAANGDRLLAEGEGQATPTSTPGILLIVEVYTVTGGTGRFAGASGQFRVQRLFDASTGATFGLISGSLALN
jgi:hypothetical protein